MKILLTNDDGVAAAGINDLRQALLDAGLEVVTIAPVENNSGVARLATFSTPVHIELTSDQGGAPIYACEGTPVDCVRVGLLSEIAPDADLVVSGEVLELFSP